MIGMTTMEIVMVSITIIFLVGMFIGLSAWFWRNARRGS
jgi:uncharacterized membrane protein